MPVYNWSPPNHLDAGRTRIVYRLHPQTPSMVPYVDTCESMRREETALPLCILGDAQSWHFTLKSPKLLEPQREVFIPSVGSFALNGDDSFPDKASVRKDSTEHLERQWLQVSSACLALYISSLSPFLAYGQVMLGRKELLPMQET